MTGLPPGRRVHQRSSGNLKTRAQCSVLSAESHTTLPSDVSPLVSRETGLSPRGMPPCRPRQSGDAHCRCQIRRVSPTRSTLSVLAKADAFTTFFHCSRTPSTPPGTTYSTGDHCRAQRIGIRLVLTCYSICPTCLRGGRGHHVSSSSLESRLLGSETSAESHGTLPSDVSPLVSRETDSRARCGRHGRAPTSPRNLCSREWSTQCISCR